MREIPVSSLGSDKVRVAYKGDPGLYLVEYPGDAGDLLAVIIRDRVPTEALLAIVADRVGSVSDIYSLLLAVCADLKTGSPTPAQPDADEIGEGR